MRICTITCQNAENYGARLQAYALSSYLEGRGHDVRVIDYRPDYMTFSTRPLFWPGMSIRQLGKLLIQFPDRIRSIARHRRLERFSSTSIRLTDKVYNSSDELRKSPPEADAYIAGSDQIWNPLFRNGLDSAYYLDFGDSGTRRVSYAASFAISSLPQESVDFIRRNIGRFDRISVRERSGLGILQSLGYEGVQVADPVFLLSREEWDMVADSSLSRLDEDYILVYDFMRSSEIRRVALQISSRTGSRIYSVGSFSLGYADRNFLTTDPATFVKLIRNSRAVICNSFHGIVFSMIYHRNFLVVMRQDGLNDRMYDILERFCLTGRIADSSSTIDSLMSDIDYKSVDGILESEILKSRKYLDDSLPQR